MGVCLFLPQDNVTQITISGVEDGAIIVKGRPPPLYQHMQFTTFRAQILASYKNASQITVPYHIYIFHAQSHIVQSYLYTHAVHGLYVP